MADGDLKRALDALLAAPRAVDGLSSAEVPAGEGLYAWWATRDVLPDLPRVPHPAFTQLKLLYVGISPARATSSQTIRSRVLGNHLGGNTGSSTFRLTLASLLLDELDFSPVVARSKVLLTGEDNRRLSNWQRQHLSLTWFAGPSPWLMESRVIAALQPPLNLAANASGRYHERLTAARAAFRAAARA
jgi:hypothetical protein